MLQYRLLIIVSLAGALLMLGVGMIVPLLPQRILVLSGSMQSVGYIASTFALTYLLLQLPLGSMADRLGAKPFLVLGYFMCAVSGLVFLVAQTPEAIFFGRLVQGAGEAPIWALGPALLSLAYPNAKGRVIGIYNAAIHAGLTAGPLLGIVLFPSAGSNAPFLIFAALSLFSGIALLRLLPGRSSIPEGSFEQVPSLSVLVGFLRLPGTQAALLGILVYGAAYGIFTSVLPAYLKIVKGFDHQSIGIYFALFYLAISVSQLIVGPLSDKYGRRLFMVSGLVIASLGIVMFDLVAPHWILMPLTVASFGLGVFCVSSMAHLNESVPVAFKGSVSGGYYLSWGLGFFFGPIAVGHIAEIANPEAGYYLLALAMLGLAFIFCLSSDRIRFTVGA